MSRFLLLNKLSSYIACDESDLISKNTVIDFVKNNENCFLRSNLGGHITCSCWILNSVRDAVLLTHHKKLNFWVQLGGHADGESDVLSSALKEAYEESGLEKIKVLSDTIFDLDYHLIPKYNSIPEHLHYDLRFIFQSEKRDQLKISSESNALRWVKISELEKYSTEKSLLRMRAKWLGKQM